MPDYDVMVVLQHPNNLAADRYINTLHFSKSGLDDWASTADTVGDGVVDAYEQFLAGGSSPFPTALVNRDFEVRVYNPDDPEPRQPVVRTGTLPGGLANPMASEVACCLSFYGERNLPRQRGRIFIGPIDQAFNSAGRPSTVLVDAMLDLADDLSGVGDALYDWQVVSRTAQTRERVQHVWVDNAWDTQRRRGLPPTSRATRDVSG